MFVLTCNLHPFSVYLKFSFVCLRAAERNAALEGATCHTSSSGVLQQLLDVERPEILNKTRRSGLGPKPNQISRRFNFCFYARY